MRILRKLLKIALVLVLIVVLIFAAIRIGVYFAYADFYNNSDKTFLIPGLSDGFVQQGFEYIESEDVYLVSGYMNDGTASRIYVVDGESWDTYYTELRKSNGNAHTGHAGGVCAWGDYVYISTSKGLDVFSLTDILSGGSAAVIGSVDMGTKASFCSVYNGVLYAGTFHREGNYETEEFQHITTPSGEENLAMIFAYTLSSENELGVGSVDYAISIGSLVQGICFIDDTHIVLSTSYGLASSNLFVHEIDSAYGGTLDTSYGSIPLYYLDSTTLCDTVKAPPMAEELVFADGRILVMCESASEKYIFGNFIGARKVYAYDTSSLLQYSSEHS